LLYQYKSTSTDAVAAGGGGGWERVTEDDAGIKDFQQKKTEAKKKTGGKHERPAEELTEGVCDGAFPHMYY
jgi:hypothetical protein